MDVAVGVFRLIELEEHRSYCDAQWRQNGEQIAFLDPGDLVHWVLEGLEGHPDVHTDGRQPEED